MKYHKQIFFALLLTLNAPYNSFGQVKEVTPTKYRASNQTIIGDNLMSYNNRPLYCNNTDAFILTGDEPFIRFAQTPYVYGSFLLGIIRDNKLKWVTECSNIQSIYKGGMMEWVITDLTFDYLKIKLSVVPMAEIVGIGIKATIENAQKDDKLIWLYGGAEFKNEGSLSWSMDVITNPDIMKQGFQPSSCKDNLINIADEKFEIKLPTDTINKSAKSKSVYGWCSVNSKLKITDAFKTFNSVDSNSLGNITTPIVTGMVDLYNQEKEIYWCIKPLENDIENTKTNAPKIEWQRSLKRVEDLNNRIIVNTPDEKLNALASASVSVIDAVWYDPVFVHGAMLWNIPFPGWRTIYGGTMYGWHDRVKKEAKHYISYQNLKNEKLLPKPDEALKSTLQDTSSRFFGLGHINKDQWVYNFQSQFFDQLITEWRSSADAELESIIYPALKLHLKWEEECFDPDGNGIYESYINSWPTDSQWYNGGGTAEETSYAYNGHKAALEMAIRKGENEEAKYHQAKLEHIKQGFFTKLWIKNKGYSGAYCEQGGFERLHENPWLYSIFLPIDAHLVTDNEAVSSLYYTKSVLQNDKMSTGGRRVWSSNWVPAVFSVRELYPGDNYHLALAYFQSGLADDGWDIMKGNFYHGAYNRNVPGDLGNDSGGTDFNDCSSMFTRALVEGLFGYRPDYPNNKVTIAPQFPKEWNNASIKTPDFSYRYSKNQNTIDVSLSITKPANIDFYIPIKATEIKNVLANGKSMKWKLLPSYGQSLLNLVLEDTANNIIIETSRIERNYEPIVLKKNVDDIIQLKIPNVKITGINDLQNIFNKTEIKNGVLNATVSNNSGHHTVILEVLIGKIIQKQIVYLEITNKVLLAKEREINSAEIPLNVQWRCVDMKDYFNADIRTIYQQKYLSPRPNTVSNRIGTDGYTAWTYHFWKQSPPIIKLDSVEFLKKDSTHIVVQKQIPFVWKSFEKNVAFTSLWDNYPKKITVPVQEQGKTIWLMVGGSTNQMQCDIANAIIIFTYEDKSQDTLSLIPPKNYWNLSPINIKAGASGQLSRGDYTNEMDAFSVPKPFPRTVQLGENCRAMVLIRKLKEGLKLESVSLQTLSQEVVVGLMGVTIMK